MAYEDDLTLSPDQLGLDEEDRNLLGQVASTEPQPDANLVPEDIIPEASGYAMPDPNNGYVGEGPAAPEAPINLDEIAATPSPVPVAATEGTPGATDLPASVINRESALDKESAAINAEKATRDAEIAQQEDDDARLRYADYIERRKESDNRLDALVKEFSSAKVTPHKTTWRDRLAVAFGGLGAGLTSAGGGGNANQGLEAVQSRWKNEADVQKSNIDLLKDKIVMARTGVKDADEGRQQLKLAADAKRLANYDLSIKQGKKQLANLGVPQADIERDKRILNLQANRKKAEMETRKAQDEHDLKQAQAAYYGRMPRGKGGKGGEGGGAGKPGAIADLRDFAVANPGDPGAVQREATRLGVKDQKQIDKAIALAKPTGEQVKAAEFGRAGIRAVTSLEKSKYVPTDADISRWLKNQRDVYIAKEAGSGGGIGGLLGSGAAGIAQSVGLLAKNEVEGLSDEGKAYFADVRRLMEPLGRAKSGAAISADEWTNFFNQYGPQSSGGFAAARKDLEDSLRLSGVAGQTLAANDKKKAAPPTAAQNKEAIEWAKKNLKDPDARAILKANGLDK